MAPFCRIPLGSCWGAVPTSDRGPLCLSELKQERPVFGLSPEKQSNWSRQRQLKAPRKFPEKKRAYLSCPALSFQPLHSRGRAISVNDGRGAALASCLR